MILRRNLRLWLAVAVLVLAACSGASSGEADPLREVNDATAARLCSSYFASAGALRDARNNFSTDGIDAAAESYDRLAADARAAGAKPFASESSKAAEATRALARYSRDALAAGPPSTAAGQSPSSAPLLTMLMKLQLPETQLYLACYSHGYTPSGP